MEGSRGFWNENSAWGQRGEEAQFSVRRPPSSPWHGCPRDQCGNKRAFTGITREAEQGKEKSSRTEEAWPLQGTLASRDVLWPPRYFCNFQWVCHPPTCLFPSTNIIKHLLCARSARYYVIMMNKGKVWSEPKLNSGGLPWWLSGKDSVVPEEGAQDPYLVRELDPTWLN